MAMTSKQRMLTALDGGMPDRLPVTTHFLMPQFLEACMGACRRRSFSTPAAGTRSPTLRRTGPIRPAANTTIRTRESRASWRADGLPPTSGGCMCEPIAGRERPATRYRFVTPKGTLSMVLESDPFTAWVVEPLIKKKRDIDLIGRVRHRPEMRRGGGESRGRGVRPAGAGARLHLLLRRLRPARHVAGRHLSGRRRAADHGNLRRPGLGPRVARHPVPAEEGIRRVAWPGPATIFSNSAAAALLRL